MSLSARCTVCPHTEDSPTAWLDMLIHEGLTGHVMSLFMVGAVPAPPRRRDHLRVAPVTE